MSNTIFFAWQLDTPVEDNKNFIWRALQDASLSLSNDARPELSPRPERDTEGVSGNPNVVQTIFNRIENCSVFVADLTFVATTNRGKKIPNPNVSLELGYAARSIGWDRTVLVMNNAFGGAEDLPFDIRQHRWPINYRITEQTQVRSKRYVSLTNVFIDALKACEDNILTRAREMFLALDTATFEIVAIFENTQVIPLPLPAKNMGETLISLQHNLAFRRLVDLGALVVVSEPAIGYSWSADGQRMIKEINRSQPSLLSAFRTHSS